MDLEGEGEGNVKNNNKSPTTTGGALDEDPEVGQGQQQVVSIQDVVNTVPTEAKEETDVLRSLDEKQAVQQQQQGNIRRKSTLSGGILDGLPEEASHIFSSSNNNQRSNTNDTNDTNSEIKVTSTKRSSAAAAADNNTTSVEEELHDLAKEMNSDGTDDDPNNNITTTTHDIMGMGNKFTNDADKLVKKARKIKNGTKSSFKDDAKETYNDFKQYLKFQKATIWQYCKRSLLLIVIATGIAALLFYGLNNPGGSTVEPLKASTSWWFLFLFVRQVITWTLAKITEAIMIDFLCLRHPILVRLLGPYLALFLIQSKGWPFHFIAFSLYDFALLYGDRDFARQWLYWQNLIKLFSKANPAGRVTENTTYQSLLVFALSAGILASLKRFFMGFKYGQAVYSKYGKALTKIMKKSLLLKKLSKHSKHIMTMQQDDNGSFKMDLMMQLGVDNYNITRGGDTDDDEDDYDEQQQEKNNEDDNDDSSDDDNNNAFIKMGGPKNVFTGSFSQSHRQQIQNLLGEWEEPVIDERTVENAGIGAIVEFRTAVSCIDREFPFSPYFGLADRRENCIESAQNLYLRLKGKDDDTLTFDRIAVIALNDEKELNHAMVRDLIKLFRPTREGELNMLDFLKSIDTLYKELRLLQASILNMQKMSLAFQKLWDTIFWCFIVWIFLLAIGIDAAALVGSLAALIVGFSFMLGNALSKAFEGLLFVLSRKPYDVGDRICVAGIDKEAPGSGSPGWIVKDLNLYTTTLVYGTTGEEATFTNGYLNSYRVINMNRSPKATISFVMKFGIDVSKEKIITFGQEVESYVKDRPREWLSFGAYRLNDVAPDLGYVEYKVILQHRESWQQIGALLTSKADVQNFGFGLTQKLGMGYESPPLPIILDQSGGDDNTSDMFRAALTKKQA